MDRRPTFPGVNPPEPLSARPVRLLICDDEPRTRQGLKALLLSHSLANPAKTCAQIQVVGESNNGQEALLLAAELHPDVILMDARMPVMDGFEATRQLKARSPEIRVVMLTMYPDQQDAARLAGADQLLLKGCPAEALLNALLG
jgi:DNA-binding NarL/FixJ family response regulator